LPDGPGPSVADADTTGNADVVTSVDAANLNDQGDGESLDAQPDVETLVCDSGQPVAVCVEYYEYLSKCLGENYVQDACYPSLIPDSAADLAQIEMLCAVNLQRVQQACR
jgi:hypothetical protein